MKDLNDFKKAGQKIYDKLHLSTYPIAIKYIKSLDKIPKSGMRPKSQGIKLSICQAFTLARRIGLNVTITSEDNFCVPSTAMHKWEDISREDFIESQVQQGWHKNVEAEIRRAETHYKFMEKIKPVEYCGLICSPLPKTIIIPDSILIYCDGAQLTHIIHALSYEYNEDYVPNSSFEGFGESCAKGGLIPFVTQKPQIVIPGAGDRAFAGISEHELAIGIPADLIFYVIKNLFKTGHFMNLNYPIRTLIPMHLNEDITPGFKFLRDKINEKKNNK